MMWWRSTSFLLPRRHCFSTQRRSLLGSVESTVRGLQIYKGIYGHAVVPQPFIVPERNREWPQDLAGYKLGRQVARAREYYRQNILPQDKIDQLSQVGMVWVPSEAHFQPVLAALRAFKELYGHLRVPCGQNDNFIVPSASPWPQESWNLPLTKRVRQLRRRRGVLAPDQIETLDQIGFVWNVFDSEWNDKIVPSLQQYKEFYGNLEIPASFQIPACSPWPKAMYGRRLGELLHRIRRSRGHLSPSQMDQLDALGIVWNTNEHRFRTRIMPALDTYFALHGDLNIPLKFVIPFQDSSDYPKECRGLRLGSILAQMRTRLIYFQQIQDHWETLEELGFCWATERRAGSNVLSEFELDQLVAGLETYHSIYGHTLVPATYDPSADPKWPESSEPSIELGKLVKKARHLNKTEQLSSEIKAYLSEHKMLWSMKKFKHRILPAIERFIQVHGHSNIPHAFRVPATPEWPRACWNESLGYQAMKIRHGHMPIDDDERQELQRLGFTFEKRMSTRWRTIVLPAMIQYVRLNNGSANVPMEFRIPATDDWDPALHGFWLGKAVYKIEKGINYKTMTTQERQQLRQLGYKVHSNTGSTTGGGEI